MDASNSEMISFMSWIDNKSCFAAALVNNLSPHIGNSAEDMGSNLAFSVYHASLTELSFSLFFSRLCSFTAQLELPPLDMLAICTIPPFFNPNLMILENNMCI